MTPESFAQGEFHLDDPGLLLRKAEELVSRADPPPPGFKSLLLRGFHWSGSCESSIPSTAMPCTRADGADSHSRGFSRASTQTECMSDRTCGQARGSRLQ